jgi:multidrug efflux pump subunit AcrB
MMDSCAKRARPIVMTSIAMCAGMVPVAMGWAGDPSFRAPMGVAVLGGLIVSTVVSLFIVPVFFTLVDDMQTAAARKFYKLLPTEEKTASAVGALAEH